MAITCGILGLPNVGKSTLFNVLADNKAPAANYPFCTIEPNSGKVIVPDARLAKLNAITNSAQVIPAQTDFVDIAGLVAGASKGEGLGNKFLAHVREANALAHVVRCFEDKDITHVSGRVDPVGDVEIIETELALADLAAIERWEAKNGKLVRAGDKEMAAQMVQVVKIKAAIEADTFLREGHNIDSEAAVVAHSLCLLTVKPVIYIANCDEGEISENQHLQALQGLAKERGLAVFPINAKIESELAELEESERQEFLAELGWSEPGLNRIIRATYELLGLQTYFTAGPQELRAWTIKRGMNAVAAAGVIHTDFAHKFIRAEVIGCDDYLHCKGEAGAKAAGKWRLEGKDYLVQDGDVIYFRVGG